MNPESTPKHPDASTRAADGAFTELNDSLHRLVRRYNEEAANLRRMAQEHRGFRDFEASHYLAGRAESLENVIADLSPNDPDQRPE